MKGGRPSEIPKEIEQARRRFERWRKNREKITRIPDRLWGLLVKMLCLCRGRSATGFRRCIPIAIARQGQAFQVVKRTLTRYRDRNLLPAMGA
jgi:hypothetical protein